MRRSQALEDQPVSLYEAMFLADTGSVREFAGSDASLRNSTSSQESAGYQRQYGRVNHFLAATIRVTLSSVYLPGFSNKAGKMGTRRVLAWTTGRNCALK